MTDRVRVNLYAVVNFGHFFQPYKSGCRLIYGKLLILVMINVSIPETNLYKSFSEFLYNLLVLLTESLNVAERL